MLELTKEMETGIDIVDAQHRELVDAVNDFIGSADKARDPVVLTETLDFMAKYCVMHFKTEQDLMNKCGYPACTLHDNQHKLFVDRFVEYKTQFQEEGFTSKLFVDLSHFLVTWIVNHIKVSDVAFGSFYNEVMYK